MSRVPKSAAALGEDLILQLRIVVLVVAEGGIGLMSPSPSQPGKDEGFAGRRPDQDASEKIANFGNARHERLQAGRPSRLPAGLGEVDQRSGRRSCLSLTCFTAGDLGAAGRSARPWSSASSTVASDGSPCTIDASPLRSAKATSSRSMWRPATSPKTSTCGGSATRIRIRGFLPGWPVAE